MTQLIKITEQEGNKVVSARELYKKLGYDKSQWKRWYEKNILNNDFAFENEDYSVLDIMSKTQGGRPTKDFALKIEFAKKIAMRANTIEGEKVRDYFIKVEKLAKQQLAPTNPLDLLKLAVSEMEKKDKQIAVLQPKAELMDKVLDAEEKIDIGQASKILELPFGRNTMFKKLREKGIFFKNRNEPKQEYIKRQYFVLKEKYIARNNHDGFVVVKVLVTQKGLEFLSNVFNAIESSKKLAVMQ
ncbi:MAG: phage antirepressor KilAC domain-containing protein [Polaribacter sp.]